MNRANMEVQKATSVNALNAAMALIRIECKRYKKYKELTWKQESPLTPRGMVGNEFKNVMSAQYTRDVEEMN